MVHSSICMSGQPGLTLPTTNNENFNPSPGRWNSSLIVQKSLTCELNPNTLRCLLFRLPLWCVCVCVRGRGLGGVVHSVEWGTVWGEVGCGLG